MNIFKKMFTAFVALFSLGIAVPAFSATATIDVDQLLMEYSKSKIATAQFRTQEESLQKIVGRQSSL